VRSTTQRLVAAIGAGQPCLEICATSSRRHSRSRVTPADHPGVVTTLEVYAHPLGQLSESLHGVEGLPSSGESWLLWPVRR
jgi:hypothetical protein